MCRPITTPPPCPCPCAALTQDVTQWCNGCYLELLDLERTLGLVLPREYTLHDVVLGTLREQWTTATALDALKRATA